MSPQRDPSRPRRLAAAVLMLALILGLDVAPAQAVKIKEEPLDRSQVIKRARRWTDARVPYSQSGYRGGYRRDCSGFVSYAWDLPENLVTWRIPHVTKRISQDELRAGDVLLNYTAPAGARHVIIFERWADKKRTKYYGLESTGQSGVDRAIRRVLPYPYRVAKNSYKPYRYVGMAGYYRKVPKRLRLPVRGYDGRVTTPEMIAERRAAARRVAAAAKAKADRDNAAESAIRRRLEADKRAAAARTQLRNRFAARLVASAKIVGGGLAAVLLVADPAQATETEQPPAAPRR